jgi:hypothetical protein
LKIIGEATKKISKDLKSQYHDIPWKEMSGMRDKLIHDYFGVDVDVVWKTVNEDIPYLKSLIENIDKYATHATCGIRHFRLNILIIYKLIIKLVSLSNDNENRDISIFENLKYY